MKKYYTIVTMSVDPDLRGEEDDHQKYSYTIHASSEKEALKINSSNFAEEGLPVYWQKVAYTSDTND